MRVFPTLALFFLLLFQTPSALEIYVIDVEGGKSSLIVSPSRESLLIDSGNIGEPAQRDVPRILNAINAAGLKQIDHLVTTHWHRDHAGGIAMLAGRIPIREFIDHGPNIQPDEKIDEFLQTYPKLYAHSKHRIVKPGDKMSFDGVDISVLASAGSVLRTPFSGATSKNPYCDNGNSPEVDKSENSQSIAIHLRFGEFRLVDPGDLSTDKEVALMCPDNPIGKVDLYVVSHHGQPGSNSEAMVHAIRPRVAIMNNGARKGGQPEVMRVLHTSPGLEDLWQLHFSLLSGQEFTVPGLFIANGVDQPQRSMPIAPMPVPPRGEPLPPEAIHEGEAYWIKVTAHTDGSFVVTNQRNGFTKTYQSR